MTAQHLTARFLEAPDEETQENQKPAAAPAEGLRGSIQRNLECKLGSEAVREHVERTLRQRHCLYATPERPRARALGWFAADPVNGLYEPVEWQRIAPEAVHQLIEATAAKVQGVLQQKVADRKLLAELERFLRQHVAIYHARATRGLESPQLKEYLHEQFADYQFAMLRDIGTEDVVITPDRAWQASDEATLPTTGTGAALSPAAGMIRWQALKGADEWRATMSLPHTVEPYVAPKDEQYTPLEVVLGRALMRYFCDGTVLQLVGDNAAATAHHIQALSGTYAANVSVVDAADCTRTQTAKRAMTEQLQGKRLVLLDGDAATHSVVCRAITKVRQHLAPRALVIVYSTEERSPVCWSGRGGGGGGGGLLYVELDAETMKRAANGKRWCSKLMRAALHAVPVGTVSRPATVQQRLLKLVIKCFASERGRGWSANLSDEHTEQHVVAVATLVSRVKETALQMGLGSLPMTQRALAAAFGAAGFHVARPQGKAHVTYYSAPTAASGGQVHVHAGRFRQQAQNTKRRQ